MTIAKIFCIEDNWTLHIMCGGKYKISYLKLNPQLDKLRIKIRKADAN